MADEVQTQADVDPEPEGVMEIETPAEGGAKVKQPVVPVSALKAERARVRNVEREKQAAMQRELDAERQKNAQLAGDLQSVRPHIEHLQKNPHLMKAGESPETQAIADDEAAQYAKDYELYTATGLDIARAKRMIVRENKKVAEASSRAAQEAVKPLAQSTAQNQSMAYLAWALNQKDRDGAPVADPEILRQVWAEVPTEYTADPRVAQERLAVAVGRTIMEGKQPTRPPQYEPTFTEAPGGFRERAYEMSPMERAIAQNQGIGEKEWTDAAKRYKPGQYNRLGGSD